MSSWPKTSTEKFSGTKYSKYEPMHMQVALFPGIGKEENLVLEQG